MITMQAISSSFGICGWRPVFILRAIPFGMALYCVQIALVADDPHQLVIAHDIVGSIAALLLVCSAIRPKSLVLRLCAAVAFSGVLLIRVTFWFTKNISWLEKAHAVTGLLGLLALLVLWSWTSDSLSVDQMNRV